VVQSYSYPIKLTAFVLSFLAACLLFTTGAQSPAATGVNSIRADELREKVTYLASEQFKGRGNGTYELNLVAEYIAGTFARNGLKAAGNNGGYYQPFDIYSSRLGSKNDVRIQGTGDTDLDLKVRTDFFPEFWSVSGTATGPLQLIEDSRADRSDLKGKIAVEVEDRIASDDPEFPLDASEERRLQDAGATAVMILQSPSVRGRGRLINLAEDFRDDLPVRMTAMATLDVPDYPTIPVLVLSADVGRQLVSALRKPQSHAAATITVDVERDIHHTQNVLGLIEGSNPSLKNEVMIIGAHYDHDGEAFGQIWYGADDNGSGTAALLEIAEAFGNGSARPARSVLLCAWAGEEKGLLGSRYYVHHPFSPLTRTVAMFQMDMIGRNEDHAENRSQQIPEELAANNANTLNVLGSAFSPDLKAAISRLNSQINLTLRFRYDFGAEDLMRRSDQWSFLQRGIPAIFFFTGLHPDYHTPRDTPDKINYPKLEKITKLVYLSAIQVANALERPQFVKSSPAAR
jgi:Zn-dependent M28 family amino/carboxypeptidase